MASRAAAAGATSAGAVPTASRARVKGSSGAGAPPPRQPRIRRGSSRAGRRPHFWRGLRRIELQRLPVLPVVVEIARRHHPHHQALVAEVAAPRRSSFCRTLGPPP
jgi:hypothetical protein